MRRDAAGGFIILCFIFLFICHPNHLLLLASPSISCHPDQRDALLRFKQSLSITGPKVASWMEDEDCCSWDSISCDNSTGNVIGLDLTNAGLQGSINSGSPLFSLCRLRILSLAGNDLLGSTVPPEIGVFTRLEYLDLSHSNISGILPTEISHLSKLLSLNLSDTFFNHRSVGLAGNDLYLSYNPGLEMQDHTMRMLVGNLTQLEELDLGSVDMSTVNPTSVMNLSSSLISLKLSFCWLGGKFPEFIFGLPNLQVIDLWWNFNLTVTLPKSKWSPGLEYLSLGGCLFIGAVPNSIGNLSRLTYLALSQNNFTGELDLGILSTLEDLQFLRISGISSFLSRSKELRILQLFGNKIKEIPSWLWSIGIDTMEELYLADNLIKGSIPPSICQLTSLSNVALSRNYLTGVIPQCLGNLTKLRWLQLRDNLLSGSLPPSLANCTSLEVLFVDNNHISGALPTWLSTSSICHLTSLRVLDMRQNYLTGVIPQCLGNLTELHELYLSNNLLSGLLPPSLANSASLRTLDVGYNSINGAPPTWLPASSISYIDLRANNFVGQWPPDIFLRSAFFSFIDLSDNKFEGALPVPTAETFYYSVSNNHFSGSLSSLLCNAANLRILDLSNNSLIGVLPDYLENVTRGLEILNLRVNEFQGQISDIFHEGSMLTSLDLSGNQFEGPLPRSLSHCKRLKVLDVGNNKIEDSFPNWLGDLPLMVLSLRSNHFYGRVVISKENHPFPMARIVDLSQNSFDGSLQDEFIIEMFGMTRDNNYDFGKQYLQSNSDVLEYCSVTINLKGIEIEMVKINVHFAMLDLSSNQFHEEIPKSIGFLKSLKGLNLSHNFFIGSIPPSVGNLTNLESLDLSSNHLIGEIPKELVKLTSLEFLDLSSNNLMGPIPLGGHIDTFPNSSFKGNPGLCGIPLRRSCGQGVQPPSEGKDGGEDGGGWLEWKYVLLGFGSGMGMGISLGYMVLEMGRPLWLVQVVIRLEASYRKMSKRKKGDQRRNGQR